jgi:peptidoglycan/xylan/chitin deacetylase (PgdA/CDA1 family)
MNRLKVHALRASLDALYASQLHRLIAPGWRGRGAILMLHRVMPTEAADEFHPNAYLELTPEFLDTVIRIVKDMGRDIIELDDVPERLARKDPGRPFVCFTFDDGYRDVYDHALPVFLRHGVPFAVYVNTSMPEGKAFLWWDLLEAVYRKADEVELRDGEQPVTMPTRTLKEKWRGFRQAYWRLRKVNEPQRHVEVRRLCREHGIDFTAYAREAAMDWDCLRRLTDTGIAKIEAHTANHPVMSLLSEEEVVREAVAGRDIIADRLGREPRHFAYPYGDTTAAGPREFRLIRELGFQTATTTRKGTLFSDHAEHLHALPRVSLSGDYQEARYARLLLNGAPFALWNRFRRLNVG